MSDIPSFMEYLFSNRAGWACLGWLDGDPLIEEIDGEHQEWYTWPNQREKLISSAQWHADQGHNLYVRQVLFAKRSGTKAAALPSAILWQDEARIDTPASLLVETSSGNYQAHIKLDRDASTADRERMMRAWRNARPGADDCSANPVAFVRVPGGHNTKRHGDWLVRYAMQSSRIYTADRLLARCDAGRGETHAPPAGAGALDAALLDYWQAHIEQLLNDDRTLPRAFVRDTPGRRILDLRAQGKGMHFHTSGTWDASRERLWLANSLVLARYLDEQIAALLWHFEVAETIEVKGETAIWADISRVIVMARAAHPNVAPRLYGVRPAPKAKTARGRAGNHIALAEQVYSILQDARAGAQAIVKTGEIAGVIGCHRRTIVTILNELRTAGRIETRPLGQHGGLVVSFSGVIYSPAPEAAQPTATPQIEAAQIVLGETGPQGGCVSPDRETDHSSELPTLAELAKNYLDQPASVIGEQYVITTTGQISHRRTARHFAQLVTSEYPYTGEQAIDAYRADQALREIIEADMWQRFFSQLRAMSDADLIAYIGGGCRRGMAELSRDGSAFDKHLYQARLKCAKQHLGWRGLTMPKRASKAAQQAQEAREDAQVDRAAAAVRSAPARPFVRFELEPLPADLGTVDRLQILKAQRDSKGATL